MIPYPVLREPPLVSVVLLTNETRPYLLTTGFLLRRLHRTLFVVTLHTTVLFNAEKHCATNWKEAEECPQASRTVKSYYSKKRFSAYSNLQHASREFVKLKQ